MQTSFKIQNGDEIHTHKEFQNLTKKYELQ